MTNRDNVKKGAILFGRLLPWSPILGALVICAVIFAAMQFKDFSDSSPPPRPEDSVRGTIPVTLNGRTYQIGYFEAVAPSKFPHGIQTIVVDTDQSKGLLAMRVARFSSNPILVAGEQRRFCGKLERVFRVARGSQSYPSPRSSSSAFGFKFPDGIYVSCDILPTCSVNYSRKNYNYQLIISKDNICSFRSDVASSNKLIDTFFTKIEEINRAR